MLVPDGAKIDFNRPEAAFGEITVLVAGVTSGFGLDLRLPAEELLDRLVYFLSDVFVEESGGAWPLCPEHGRDHSGRIVWHVQERSLGCDIRCEAQDR
jgi:hypothetical protein